MLNSIVGRNRMLSPLSDTEKRIIRSATRLFLKNGFSGTTLKMISDDTGIRQGTLCYHFHTKEDMLYLLIQELMDFHRTVIRELLDGTEDKLFSFALEVTAQISLCESDERARNLYYSAYSLPGTFELIKNLSANKNRALLGDELKDWTEKDFYVKETVASCIEYSAFVNPCGPGFTLEDKISVILDSLMLLYEVSAHKRQEIIDRIFTVDYRNIGKEMFESFVKKLD